MRIFDMHVHTYSTTPNTESYLGEMEKAGIYGGFLFSAPPKEYNSNIGLDFEERLNQIFDWTKGYEDRLYPVLWVHPYEKDILKNVEIAAEKGISAFKIICNNFYPTDEKNMELAHAIAKTGKPLIFHSGILYSKTVDVTADYNRPASFEGLIKVKGLKFSMGHCSWPWTDECIALFGKVSYLRSVLKDPTECAEMFLDITPGTPPAYREELLTKLYRSMQNTGDYVMFGTDTVADRCVAESAKEIIESDRKILDKLGVSLEMREKMYHDNLMRFLGKKEYTENFVYKCWGFDACSKHAKDICRKWYEKLGFPKEYDADFEKALEEIKISDAISIDNYDLGSTDGKRNLLSFLFMCEALEKKYKEKGIDEKILLDTLRDIVIWTNVWSGVKGETYLGELGWLVNHLKMKLFRLGSLEFMMGSSHADCPELGLKKGDNILEVHIPHDSSFSAEDCKSSFDAAIEFFAKHYPEFKFNHFTCHSWLLDTELKKLLKPSSNILGFQNMFTIIDGAENEADAALRYVFDWNTTRINLRNKYPVSSLAENMKKHVLLGGKLYERIGAIKIN